ncbi:hypothetical protein P20495_0503 [Pseudoalteromonas sp. BSi20495]|nr:hypothetical protein P20495_0503 [Pseudoalteromonas sp. BSi20495]
MIFGMTSKLKLFYDVNVTGVTLNIYCELCFTVMKGFMSY